MALARVRHKKIIKIIAGVLLAVSFIVSSCSLASNKIALEAEKETTKKLKEEISILASENKKLEEEAAIVINSTSDIRLIRDDLIDAIKEVVESRNRDIKDVDILRALNSTENRIMDEYVRIASLILATMETESNFKYITNENNNGTTDYGIMQVNDVVIPHLKEALGNYIDPVNNKDHNVEGGSYEIYECYLKAKDKHPEDVIWWTYAYYNRGQYFESTDSWKNPNNPNYKAVHEQANVRSNKFKECYNAYYEVLSSAN